MSHGSFLCDIQLCEATYDKCIQTQKEQEKWKWSRLKEMSNLCTPFLFSGLNYIKGPMEFSTSSQHFIDLHLAVLHSEGCWIVSQN